MTPSATTEETQVLSWSPSPGSPYRVVWTGTPNAEIDLERRIASDTPDQWQTLASCPCSSQPQRMKDLQVELMRAYRAFSYCLDYILSKADADVN
jgi:hypothetical protein